MRKYQHLSEDDLRAKISKLDTALEEALTGDRIAVVAGEGRRMEYADGDLSKLEALRAEYHEELCRRSGSYRSPGAIGVRILP